MELGTVITEDEAVEVGNGNGTNTVLESESDGMAEVVVEIVAEVVVEVEVDASAIIAISL